MRYNDTVKLISVTYSADSIGNQVESETKREIYANRYSFGRSLNNFGSDEFFKASASGLKPIKKFEIFTGEYSNETKLEHNGAEYRIIHVDEKGDKTYLTCEKVMGNA